MKILATQLREDGTRFKGLLDGWPDLDAPTGKQVKTRTLYSGVTNGSERNDLTRGNYAHPDERLPQPWGYQNVGEVIELGPEATELKVGDVVYSSCDHTEFALFDEDWLCVKLPAEVDRREAAMFGMTSVAVHTCRNADIRMGEQVLIVGAGIIGQVAAQVADAMGGRVTICDVDEARLELARSIGAAETVLNSGGEGWKQHIEDFSFDVIIDVAGVPGLEDALIAAAKVRGRVMLIAGRGPVNYTFNLGQVHEITIKQNSHFDRDDLHQLCRLVAQGRVKLTPLLQDVAPVERAHEFYDKLRDQPGELLGTVFEWPQ